MTAIEVVVDECLHQKVCWTRSLPKNLGASEIQGSDFCVFVYPSFSSKVWSLTVGFVGFDPGQLHQYRKSLSLGKPTGESGAGLWKLRAPGTKGGRIGIETMPLLYISRKITTISSYTNNITGKH